MGFFQAPPFRVGADARKEINAEIDIDVPISTAVVDGFLKDYLNSTIMLKVDARMWLSSVHPREIKSLAHVSLQSFCRRMSGSRAMSTY